MKHHTAILQKTREQNILTSALIELTYRCNLDCFFCYNDLSVHGQAMKLSDYYRLLDDLAEMGVLTLSLSGGEPTAYPHFFEVGAYARKLGFAVTLKTNGHSVGERIAKRIREEIDPNIIETSLHGATPEVHDRQTQVKGSFERLIRNVKSMQSMGLRIKLNSTLTAWNEHQLEDMHDLADKLGLTLRFDPDVTPRDDGDTSPLSIRASREGIRRMFEINLERARQQQTAAQQTPGKQTLSIPAPKKTAAEQQPTKDKNKRYKNCGAGSTVVAIDPFGNVYPCVAYRRSVGNVHQQSIQDIWKHSVALTEIREISYQAHELKVRENLSDFCPGLANTRMGSPLKSYPDAEEKSSILMEIKNARQSN